MGGSFETVSGLAGSSGRGMIEFSDDYPDDFEIACDLCIIGTGPAAAAVACALRESAVAKKLHIVVLESGDMRLGPPPADLLWSKYESEAQQLYSGELGGWLGSHKRDYLTSSRLRHFGGTSSVWSGWCWPLEPHDLVARGLADDELSWPFPYEALSEFYGQAQQFLGLDDYDYENVEHWCKALRPLELERMPLEASWLRTRMLRFMRTDVRVAHWCRLPHVRIIQNANVVSLETQVASDRRIVTAAVVQAIESGRPGRVIRCAATRYVLAAGAIENTRLLLLSKLGDSSGHLGRHLTEHPYVWVGGRFKLGAIPTAIQRLYFSPKPIAVGDGGGVVAALVPCAEFLERERIGNFRVLLGGTGSPAGTINVSWEQSQNPGSHISLATSSPPDRLGRPRVRVCLDSTEVDARTVKTAITSVQRTLQDLGYGSDFELPDLDADPWSWASPHEIVPGNHPMGTTRMSRDPADGVVDEHCRLHDVANTYVAGSSVFPMGGYANPMLTLVALAMRLGHHLSQQWTRDRR